MIGEGGGGGVSKNEKILCRNFLYNPTYFLGDFSARNMGFEKQLPKPAKPNISIHRTNHFHYGTHRTTYFADTIPNGEHSHVTFFGNASF